MADAARRRIHTAIEDDDVRWRALEQAGHNRSLVLERERRLLLL
jgi:hypothetical protein